MLIGLLTTLWGTNSGLSKVIDMELAPICSTVVFTATICYIAPPWMRSLITAADNNTATVRPLLVNSMSGRSMTESTSLSTVTDIYCHWHVCQDDCFCVYWNSGASCRVFPWFSCTKGGRCFPSFQFPRLCPGFAPHGFYWRCLPFLLPRGSISLLVSVSCSLPPDVCLWAWRYQARLRGRGRWMECWSLGGRQALLGPPGNGRTNQANPPLERANCLASYHIWQDWVHLGIYFGSLFQSLGRLHILQVLKHVAC